jgi:hypothetical protein
MAGGLRLTLLYLAAAILFVFSAGPALLSLLGSVIPDQALFSFPPDWFGHGMTLDNYRYIFTGELPSSYAVRGANRGMISDAARQVPASMVNSGLVALAVMALNILIGAPAAYAGGGADHALLPADPGHGAARHQECLDPGPHGPDPALHGADPLGVLPPHPARHRGRRDRRRLYPDPGVHPGVHPALPAEPGRDRPVRLHAVLCRVPVRPGALGDAANRPLAVVMAALARNTDVSWGLLNSSIFLAVLPSLALVVIVWRFVVEGILVGGVKG